MTQPKAKPRTKLTGADYIALTPPTHRGVRYQLIEGELIQMAGPNHAHQVFVNELYYSLRSSIEPDAGEIITSPYDVAIDEHNTFQPDLLFVSNERRHIFDGHGVTGAPDVVVEVLSESTRQRDLTVKLPVYARNGVREVWMADLRAATMSKYVRDGDTLILERVYQPNEILTSQAIPGIAIDLSRIFDRIRGAALPDS